MIKNKGNLTQAINELKNDSNNAVAHVYEDAKFGQGLLEEATVTLKDNFATSDAPTQASSLILKNFTPKYDATVVSKLKEAGAAIVGKTHLDELALGGTGKLSAFGLIKNPIDNTRIIGGSSSGAAATLTESISIALGSDTGDSVRLPASYTGKVGFKPSYGAVSRFGLFAYASSLDTVGWLTHNTHDAIIASQVLFGKDSKDMTSRDIELPVVEELKPKKVAVLKDVENVLDAEEKIALESVVQKLKNDGIEVEEVEVPIELLNAIDITYSVISFSEASSNDANLNGVAFGNRVDGKDWADTMTKTRTEGFGSLVQKRFTLGAFFLATENQKDIFEKAQKVRRLIVDAFNKIYDEYDLLIFPSTKIAPKLEEEKDDSWHTSFLIHSNFAGTPSITIPFAKKDGMPYGLSLGSKIYTDKKLLSHTLYIERILGGNNE